MTGANDPTGGTGGSDPTDEGDPTVDPTDVTDGSGQTPGTGRAAPADPALAALTYEQARTELASVVERLEVGGCTLEQALELWERGEALAQVCQQRLEGARARLTAS